MSRVLFETERPATTLDPGRADIACFVGLIRVRPAATLSASVQAWLQSQGWFNPNYARPLDQFADLPIPVESYDGFTAMFDPGGSALSFGTDYLAAAVRSFFAQGGRRCYVVRMDDPLTPADGASSRAGKLAALLPSDTYQPGDPRSWHGVGHLAGLPDVAFLSLPDLPVLVASRPTLAPIPPAQSNTGPEEFAECAAVTANLTANPSITSPANATFQVGVPDLFTVTAAGTPPLRISQVGSLPAGITFKDNRDGTATLSGTPVASTLCDLTFTVSNAIGKVTQTFTLIVTENVAAPRLTAGDYANWAGAVGTILEYLASGSLHNQSNLREVQFVAAFPLPLEPAVQNSSSAVLAQDIHQVIANFLPETVQPPEMILSGNLSSAFLQLAYPWLKTTGSHVLRESLEPPDGALVGLLARNALKRGTFTCATKIKPAEIYDLWPVLPPQETRVSSAPLRWGDPSPKPLVERLSLFGFKPDGIRLISDVTTYPQEAYRPACVNRLVSVICRAARRLGEDILFEQNGANLWARVEGFLQELLTRLWNLNALDGQTAKDAFSVRCDRSTMTQNDLDNGRLVAEVVFNAAATIELIRVTLALETSGGITQESAASMAEVG